MTAVIWRDGQIGCPCGRVFQSGFTRTPTIRLGFRYHVEAHKECPDCQGKKYLVPIDSGPMVNVANL